MREQLITVQLTAAQFAFCLDCADGVDTAPSAPQDVVDLANGLSDTLRAATEYRTSAVACETHPTRRASWELFIDGPVAAVAMGFCQTCHDEQLAQPALAMALDGTLIREAWIPLDFCPAGAGHWVGTVADCPCSTLAG